MANRGGHAITGACGSWWPPGPERESGRSLWLHHWHSAAPKDCSSWAHWGRKEYLWKQVSSPGMRWPTWYFRIFHFFWTNFIKVYQTIATKKRIFPYQLVCTTVYIGALASYAVHPDKAKVLSTNHQMRSSRYFEIGQRKLNPNNIQIRFQKQFSLIPNQLSNIQQNPNGAMEIREKV